MAHNETRGRVAAIVRSLAEAGYADALVLTPETYASVVTDRRLELIEAIDATEGRSVSELAEHLGREQSAVSRDLDRLFECDVLDYEREGRRKVPVLAHDAVLAEPLV